MRFAKDAFVVFAGDAKVADGVVQSRPTMSTLPPDTVHLWLFDPTALADPTACARSLACLQPVERERAARFVYDADRCAFIAARALARVVLARYASAEPEALRFETNAHGKPRLVGPWDERSLRFNVTNTRSFVACAVVRGREVGVDAEELREAPPGVAERFFAPPEIAVLRALEPDGVDAAFFSFWTLKESFMKAVGLGLSLPPASFAVALQPPRLLDYGRYRAEADAWAFELLTPTQRHHVAVCVRAPRSQPIPIVCRWLPADLMVSPKRALS
jgi:4'-phosphopantetheinyl transferase